MNALAELELALLLEGIFRHYGFDFRDYVQALLTRRIQQSMKAEQVTTLSALQDKVLHDPACFERVLLNLSVHVTSMFRDPGFYYIFRQQIVPYLQTYPFLRIWHAGCATGEEVYSMAILLEEEGLYDRTRIYATDFSETVLTRAKSGIFPLRSMQEYTNNYIQAAGKQMFSDYYTAQYDHGIFRPALQRNIIWAQHNLVTDGSFNEFQVIVCRNTMIYFNKTLQDRVHHLFYDSLMASGFLGLGSKESMQGTPHAQAYSRLDAHEKWYRKAVKGRDQ